MKFDFSVSNGPIATYKVSMDSLGQFTLVRSGFMLIWHAP